MRGQLVRYGLLWVVMTALAIWWVAYRGDMSVGEAWPVGLVAGTAATGLVIAAARKVAGRR